MLSNRHTHTHRPSTVTLAAHARRGLITIILGRTTAAFIAMDSMAELEAKALYNLASSETKDFPALPKGTLKRFGLQCTTSL